MIVEICTRLFVAPNIMCIHKLNMTTDSSSKGIIHFNKNKDTAICKNLYQGFIFLDLKDKIFTPQVINNYHHFKMSVIEIIDFLFWDIQFDFLGQLTIPHPFNSWTGKGLVTHRKMV